MSIQKIVSQFRSTNPDDLTEVLDAMERLASNEPGWMQIQPWVDDDDLVKRSLFERVFSSKGPAVPNATWVPARAGSDGGDEIGFAHGAGPDALARLGAAGVHPPAEWTSRSDHRVRGLVLVGPSGSHRAVLDFILAASATLSSVPTDDRWLYGVSRRTARRKSS